MKPWKALLETLHLAALALWLGAAVMSGAFAARVFPVMRDLKPTLHDFARYQGDHWRLAAGKLANENFFIADVVQFSSACLTGLSLAGLIALRLLSPRRPSTWLRSLAVAVGMSSLLGMLLFVTPPMNAHLKLYWNAALAGDNALAQKHQAAFSELHPLASGLIAATAIAVFVSLVASAWSISHASIPDADNHQTPPRIKKYPLPLLARTRK